MTCAGRWDLRSGLCFPQIHRVVRADYRGFYLLQSKNYSAARWLIAKTVKVALGVPFHLSTLPNHLWPGYRFILTLGYRFVLENEDFHKRECGNLRAAKSGPGVPFHLPTATRLSRGYQFIGECGCIRGAGVPIHRIMIGGFNGPRGTISSGGS